MKAVLTCEHAGNLIPQKFRDLFPDSESILASHRGYDPGAFDLFEALREVSWYSDYQAVSRLLVEVNRSMRHPQLFSEFTGGLSASTREMVLKEFYLPYRSRVENRLRKIIENGEEVLHFSVHTFTPELDGNERNADIGLLFDPGREQEKTFCFSLKGCIRENVPDLKIRFNYPYLGKADGFTTYLRKVFPKSYRGIELEVNQKFVTDNKMDPAVKEGLRRALLCAIAEAY